MKFAQLSRPDTEEQFSERFIIDVPPEPVRYPSDPDFIATVYFDRERFSDDEIDTVMARYAADYPHENIYPSAIDARDLRQHRYLTSVRAVRTFNLRGYVSLLEDRQVPAGHRADTSYAREHKQVAKAHAFMTMKSLEILESPPIALEAVSDPTGQQPGVPRHSAAPFTGSDIGPTWDQLAEYLPAWREEFDEQDDIPDWEEFRIRKMTPEPFALVETNGLLLGRSRVNADDTIHMAYAGTPHSFMRDGRLAINSGDWIQQGSGEIVKRLQRELDPAVTADLFNSRYWPSLRGGEAVDVTPAMVATWQSQELASLRKISWRILAEESPSFINNELYADRHAPTLRGGVPRHPVGVGRLGKNLPKDSLAGAMGEDITQYIGSLGRLGHRGASAGDTCVTLSDRDLLIGSFYGMRYDDLPPDSKPDEIYGIAFWLGHLRRHGRATMDCWFRESLVDVDRDCLSDMVFSMLSEQAWEVLMDAAHELEQPKAGGGVDISRTVNVTYSWSRGAEPWSAIRDGDTIAITGPLLYFPVNEREMWAEKAEFIRENQGFVAPAPQ